MRASVCIFALFAGAPAPAQVFTSTSGPSAGTGFSTLQRAPQATGKGVIEGTVVNSITQEAVKKAQVALQGSAFLNAVTDASGHFLFKDLPAGTFNLQANAEGFQVSLRGASTRQVKLAEEGKASGVTLSVTPNGSLSGRVVDEDGTPMQHCNPTLLRYQYQQGSRVLMPANGSQSDDKGEYRITNVQPGKYYVLARCGQSKTLPHAFMERGPNVNIPSQHYAPLFYPSSADFSGATTVTLAAGTDLGGINFRMQPVSSLTIQGHVSAAEPEALQRGVQLILRSRIPELRNVIQFHAPVQQSGDFQFRNVSPGSYDLEAFTTHGDPFYYSQVPVDIGAAPMDPIDVALLAAGTISGSITVEGDTTTPATRLENLQVNVTPIEMRFPMQQRGNRVQKDGTFTVKGVTPGKFQVVVNNSPGYIGSITWNDQALPGTEFEAGNSGGTLKIVVSTKWAKLDGTLKDESTDNQALTALVWPDEASLRQMGSRLMVVDEKHHFQISNIAPGKYHGCAIENPQPWMLLQNENLMKKIESRCESFELTEGGQATLQLPLLSSADIDKLSEDQ